MALDMEALFEKVNSAPNTQGLGGIRGLFGEFVENPACPFWGLSPFSVELPSLRARHVGGCAHKCNSACKLLAAGIVVIPPPLVYGEECCSRGLVTVRWESRCGLMALKPDASHPPFWD